MTFTYLGNENEGQQDSNNYSQFAPQQQFQQQQMPEQQQSFTYLGNENDQQAEGSTEDYNPIASLDKGIKKVGRLGVQGALGRAEAILMRTPAGLAGTLGVSLAGKYGKATAPIEFRKNLIKDINELTTKKSRGKLDEQEQALLNHSINLLKNPEEAEAYTSGKDYDFGAISLIEKGIKNTTGIDITPKDGTELTARIMGFLRDPVKSFNTLKNGINAKNFKEFLEVVTPKPKEAISAGAAAVGLQYAADNELGPMGSLAMGSLGFLLPTIFGKGYKFAKNPIKTTKQGLAKVASIPATYKKSQEAVALQKELITKFREAGIQPDIGTITGSNLVKGVQTMLDQSQFTGEKLDVFKKNLLNQITDQYSEMANQIGEYKFQNTNELGTALQESAKVEDLYLGHYQKPKGYVPRSLVGRVDVKAEPQLGHSQQQLLTDISSKPFANDASAGVELINKVKKIEAPIRKNFAKEYGKLNERVSKIPSGKHPELAENLKVVLKEFGGTLLEGASSTEARFLKESRRLLSKLKIGNIDLETTIGELLKTKKTLGDIPNWEIRGSRIEEQFKYLNRTVNEAIEKALQAKDLRALADYKSLNRRYSGFKNTFENKSVSPLFRKRNVKTRDIFNNALKADNLEATDRILSHTESGKITANKLKRDFVQSQFKGKSLETRQVENLRSAIGPQHEKAVNRFINSQNIAVDRIGKGGIPTVPKGAKKVPIPKFNAWIPKKPLAGRGSVHKIQKAKNFFDKIKNKKPETLNNLLNSVSGIREVREILSASPEGIELYNSIARFKIDEIFGANLKQGVNNQLKIGTFSKVLNNPRNRDIIKELVGPDIFNRMVRLESRTADLAETAQKFFNASKSGSRSLDYLIVGKVGMDLLHLMGGNPWPLVRTAGGVSGTRYLVNMITDPEFLKLVEESILTSKKVGMTERLNTIVKKIANKAKEYKMPGIALLENAPREDSRQEQ